MKDSLDEVEKLKEERDDFKARLDSKERDQSKFDSKIKALEKVINTNSYRTPSVGVANKENNRPTFATPAKTTGSGGSSNGGSGSRYGHHHHHHITGAVSGHGTKAEHVTRQEAISSDRTSNDRPSTISFPKTPITSTFRSETPIQSTTYRSTNRVNIHGSSTVTQSINRFQNAANQLPPHTPLKEGVPVANKRNQRRSKSAEMWLDHKPANTAKIGMHHSP